MEFVNSNNEVQAHLYLEQLMLFPVDIQDEIINDVSHLAYCNYESVSKVISQYTIFELK